MRDDPTAISFVKLIEKHPCLWNYTLFDYNKREATDSAWKAIATEMCDTELNCRDRWKNIRCSFVRSYNSTKAKSRYYLADQLAFLVPFTKGKLDSDYQSVEYDDKPIDEMLEKCPESINHTSNEGETEDAVERFTSSDDDDHYDMSIHSPSLQIIEKEKRTPKRKYMAHRTSNTSTLSNKADFEFKRACNSVHSTATNHDDDTDMLFFRSIIPDVKKLSAKQKRVFKTKVMTILDELIDEA